MDLQDRLRRSKLKVANLSEISTLITDGDHGSADYREKGIRFVLSEAVEEGWIEAAKTRFISNEHHQKLPRSSLKAGDVLVTKTGAYFGKSAVVPVDFGPANTIAHVGRIVLKRNVNCFYVSTFLNSKYGHAQLRRRGIKATRPEIKLIEFDDIEIAIASDRMQMAIEEEVHQSHMWRKEAKEKMRQAEAMLINALGLDSWSPSNPLTYKSASSEIVAANRMDAEYFHPRVRELIEHLSRDNLTVGDVAVPRREHFQSLDCESFSYIEIGDVSQDGTASHVQVACADAPSRATWHVQAGDVITSTVRPNRRLSALIEPYQSGSVCSSGFVVLSPSKVPPELLLTYLRLPPVCELMALHASASMYPTIAERDILRLPVKEVDDEATLAVCLAVREGRQARVHAQEAVDRAKHAVEVAIEEGEPAALRILERREA